MPRTYSNVEYADMHFVYGFCNGNAREAVREYSRRYPNRRLPHYSTFINVHINFREHGFGGRRGPEHGIQRRVNGLQQRRILNAFRENNRLSIRRAARQTNMACTTIFRTLKQNHFKAYHLSRVQALHPGDAERRIQFCRIINQKLEQDHRFLHKILWSDESCFTRRGMVNFHNLRVWSTQHPHEVRPRNFQREFSVNVWMGIVGNNVLGPFLLPHRLNGQYFLEFLQENHAEFLENVPLNVRNQLYFQLDGCPAHYFAPVLNWLNTNYGERWIGRGGPVAWPPRSPDITPMDFFLWGYIKDIVYATPVNTREELIQRIRDAARTITPEHLSNVRRSILRRSDLCINQNGSHFEQLL